VEAGSRSGTPTDSPHIESFNSIVDWRQSALSQILPMQLFPNNLLHVPACPNKETPAEELQQVPSAQRCSCPMPVNPLEKQLFPFGFRLLCFGLD